MNLGDILNCIAIGVSAVLLAGLGVWEAIRKWKERKGRRHNETDL